MRVGATAAAGSPHEVLMPAPRATPIYSQKLPWIVMGNIFI